MLFNKKIKLRLNPFEIYLIKKHFNQKKIKVFFCTTITSNKSNHKTAKSENVAEHNRFSLFVCFI